MVAIMQQSLASVAPCNLFFGTGGSVAWLNEAPSIVDLGYTVPGSVVSGTSLWDLYNALDRLHQIAVAQAVWAWLNANQ